MLLTSDLVNAMTYQGFSFDFSFMDDYIGFVRGFISFMIYARFYYGKVKALPAIIGNVSNEPIEIINNSR